MKWIIEKNRGVGPVHFGMKREEIRQILKASQLTDGELSKAGVSDDIYFGEGIRIRYTKYNKCGAIEFVSPAFVSIEGKELLNSDWDETVEWFSKMDNEVYCTDDQLVSYKTGIAAERNQTEDYLDKITVFEPDFFLVRKGLPNPLQQQSFHIQCPYVENIESTKKLFRTSEDAFKTLFAPTTEWGIILWNAIPVKFSYSEDGAVLLSMAPLLDRILSEASGKEEFNQQSENLEFTWSISWTGENIELISEWKRVHGGYQQVLNSEALRKVVLLKKDFLAEWKMVLVQICTAFENQHVEFEGEQSNRDFLQAEDLILRIDGVGKWYKLTQPNLESSILPEREKSIKKILLGLLIITVSFVTIYWLFGGEKSDPFWLVKEYWIWLVSGIIIAFGGLSIFSFFVRKKMR